MKTRRRQKKRRQTKKNRQLDKARYCSIRIDWNAPDRGYSVLTSKRVFDYVLDNCKKGFNRFQTVPGKNFKMTGTTTIHLQTERQKSWPVKLDWYNAPKCTTRTSWIKSSPCKIGTKCDHCPSGYYSKLFVKLKGNKKVAGFGSYLMALYTEEIDLDMHKRFVLEMKKTFRRKEVFIHNEEVEWFHAKEARKTVNKYLISKKI